jgi:hypothetical protein
MKNIITSWKTSVAALFVALLTALLILKQITVTEWIEGFGAIATIVGLLAKDWDKTDKP